VRGEHIEIPKPSGIPSVHKRISLLDYFSGNQVFPVCSILHSNRIFSYRVN